MGLMLRSYLCAIGDVQSKNFRTPNSPALVPGTLGYYFTIQYTIAQALRPLPGSEGDSEMMAELNSS